MSREAAVRDSRGTPHPRQEECREFGFAPAHRLLRRPRPGGSATSRMVAWRPGRRATRRS